MATNPVSSYLKFANLQMASESMLDRFPATRTETAPQATREPDTPIIPFGTSNDATGHEARGAPDEIEFSRTDVELLRLVSAGHSTKQIAELRSRSPATVRNQLSALYQKLGVARRSEAVAKLVQRKLEEPES